MGLTSLFSKRQHDSFASYPNCKAIVEFRQNCSVATLFPEDDV